MANWTTLKAAIADVIKANNNQEITGQVLQNALNSIVNSVGENATFAGIAIPTTNPGNPDGPIFYIAGTSGVYSNFNGIEIARGEAAILRLKNSAWEKLNTGLASFEFVNSIVSSVVFAADYAVNINNISEQEKQIAVSIYGYAISGNNKYTKIAAGSTSYSVSVDGIHYVVLDSRDNLLKLISYRDDYDSAYLTIGSLYIQSGDFKIHSAYLPCNFCIDGEKIKGLSDSIYGDSVVVGVSQKAISNAITSINRKIDTVLVPQWVIPDDSMIENNYQRDNIDMSNGTMSITNTSGISLFSPIIFSDSKAIRFTPGATAVAPWVVIGYKDYNNICLVGIKRFGWQFVNVDLATQKYTLLKSGSMHYTGYQKIVIDDIGDTIKWYQGEDNLEAASIKISELIQLGANLSVLTVGLCAYSVSGPVIGNVFEDVSIQISALSTQIGITDEIGDSQKLAISQLGVTKLIKPLKGKKLAIMGDSISTYSGYIPDGNATFFPNSYITDVEQTWWKKLLSKSEMVLTVNQSWSGSRITNGRGTDSMFCAESRYGSLGSPDIIIVFGGTNDFLQGNPNCPLGEFVKQTDGEKDLQYFRQAYQFLVEKLQATYPSAHIYLCVPLQRNYGIWENNQENWSQQDLWNTVKEVSEYYGCNLIDLSKCGINHYNLSVYLSDGLHPKEEGMDLISKYIYKEILKGEYGYI